jgi:GMP synthase-like glutamine amidotransferase
MRALLISNFYDADAGFIGQQFRRHGYSFSECHRERRSSWPSLEGHDLVLSLGSDWSVYWPHVASEVAAEADLIRRAHDGGVPVFGICYGNQIMAHALGGTVERAREKEIGWYDIVSDVPEIISPGPWFEWHSDVVTVPGGATELARTSVGPQAWRMGRSFCTQFHPEVSEAIVRRWVEGGGDEEARAFGRDPQQMIDETRRHVADSRPNAERLVDWFVETVAKG